MFSSFCHKKHENAIQKSRWSKPLQCDAWHIVKLFFYTATRNYAFPAKTTAVTLLHAPHKAIKAGLRNSAHFRPWERRRPRRPVCRAGARRSQGRRSQKKIRSVFCLNYVPFYSVISIASRKSSRGNTAQQRPFLKAHFSGERPGSAIPLRAFLEPRMRTASLIGSDKRFCLVLEYGLAQNGYGC